MLHLIRLKAYIREYLDTINSIIGGVVLKEFVGDIARSASFGGKRIRPIIIVLISNLLGGRFKDKFINSAVAIELIHIASLLHDDVIDQSSTRHNQNSAHIIFGNQKTILAGDFLFAESFKKMVEVGNLSALNIISKASSILAMGELNQLSIKGDINISIENYHDIIYKKTASLFEASCEIAAIIQQTENTYKIKEFGRNIGMAFQIIDDLIDYTSEDLNKERGVDFKESKITLPIIYALSSKSLLEDVQKVSLTNLFKKQEKEFKDFAKALELINISGALNYCKNVAVEHCNNAKNCILELGKEKEEFKIIEEIIEFFIKRTF